MCSVLLKIRLLCSILLINILVLFCDILSPLSQGEFVEDGTETHFSVGNHDCCIKAVSSGKRREGIIHTLIVDDREIPEAVE